MVRQVARSRRLTCGCARSSFSVNRPKAGRNRLPRREALIRKGFRGEAAPSPSRLSTGCRGGNTLRRRNSAWAGRRAAAAEHQGHPALDDPAAAQAQALPGIGREHAGTSRGTAPTGPGCVRGQHPGEGGREAGQGRARMLAKTRSKPRGRSARGGARPAPCRTPSAHAAVEAGIGTGGEHRLGIEVAGHDRARRLVAAASPRMPVPVPTSSTRRGRRRFSSSVRASRQPRVSRGGRCRRPAPPRLDRPVVGPHLPAGSCEPWTRMRPARHRLQALQRGPDPVLLVDRREQGGVGGVADDRADLSRTASSSGASEKK